LNSIVSSNHFQFQPSKLIVENVNQKQPNDFVYPPSQSSRRSSHSTTTTNTDDDQYELVRKLPSDPNNDSNQTVTEIKPISSPEMLSSAASLLTSSSSSSSSDEDEQQQQQQQTVTVTPDEEKSMDNESTRRECVGPTTEESNSILTENPTV
jgi:hypothetical protein